MNSKTASKLKFLKIFAQENFPKWKKQYRGLNGVHIGIKVKGGKEKRIYSIIFHVDQKFDNPQIMLPSYIPVEMPNGKIIDIPTDVLESGRFTLNAIMMGDATKNNNVSAVGTIGMIMVKGHDVYMISNMHVLAPNFLNKKIFKYDIRFDDFPRQKIRMFNNQLQASGTLIKAQFGGIDVAVAQVSLPNPLLIEESIVGIGKPTGIVNINFANYKNMPIAFVGNQSGLRKAHVTGVGITKSPANRPSLTNLIQLQKITQDGDSGSPLIDERNRIAGIIVGSDKDNSYAIHILDILDFFKP